MILVERHSSTPDFEVGGEAMTETNQSHKLTPASALSNLKVLVEDSQYRIVLSEPTRVQVSWCPEEKVKFDLTFSGSIDDMAELYNFATQYKAGELAQHSK